MSTNSPQGDPLGRSNKFFKGLDAGRERQALEQDGSRQRRYEHAVVAQILARCGLGQSTAAWVREEKFRLGTEGLSLAWFNEKFEDFPLHLGAQKIEWAHKTTLADFFKRFTKTRIFEAYKQFLITADLDDREARLGFVFEMPKLGRMILHNLPRDVDTLGEDVDHGVRLVYPNGRPVVVYVIEEFSKLLDVLTHTWQPAQ